MHACCCGITSGRAVAAVYDRRLVFREEHKTGGALTRRSAPPSPGGPGGERTHTYIMTKLIQATQAFEPTTML